MALTLVKIVLSDIFPLSHPTQVYFCCSAKLNGAAFVLCPETHHSHSLFLISNQSNAETFSLSMGVLSCCEYRAESDRTERCVSTDTGYCLISTTRITYGTLH